MAVEENEAHNQAVQTQSLAVEAVQKVARKVVGAAKPKLAQAWGVRREDEIGRGRERRGREMEREKKMVMDSHIKDRPRICRMGK